MQAEEQQRLEVFLQWLTRHLSDSLYAGAPHARRHFALRGLHIVLSAFQHDHWLAQPLDGGSARRFQPFAPEIHSAGLVQVRSISQHAQRAACSL